MKVLSLLLASLAFAPFASQEPLVSSDPHASERALARQRYQRVESELAARDLASLTPQQRVARRELLDLLHGYVERADFGRQDERPLARLPQFIDDEGRRCAMAELLFATGEEALVSEVAAANNEAWIVDLSEDPRFLDWLDARGLTMFEAARIQGPAMPLPPRPPPKPFKGPGDTNGGSRASPGSARAGVVSTPVGGLSNGPSTASTGAAASAILGSTFNVDSSSWWLWWEYNKLEFLRPNRLSSARQTSADDSGRSFSWQLDLVGRTMLPTLLRALEDPDARVRVAAVKAVGRIGGSQAVEPLLAHMEDASLQVRDTILLGLGASGAPAAQKLLLELARDGQSEGIKDIGQRGRALAIVALGLGRRAGFETSVDDAIVELLDLRVSSDRERIGVAAMTYALLAPSETMTTAARGLATNASESIAVRCRAIEALRGSTDSLTLAALQHLASCSRIELRRSAALGLGEFDHPLAAAALMTAHDLEKEELSRCFVLISLGRRGGSNASKYLLDVHANGNDTERPWAALALGLAARNDPDPAILAALRDGAAETARVEDRGAYSLALGIAGDSTALPFLRTALEHSADANARMYAAQALALLGGEPARAALLARSEVEKAPLARSQVALALGVLGKAGDVDPIARALHDAADPLLEGQLAAAIAFHGSSEALHCLGNMLVRPGANAATRAAAIDGLGMLLGHSTPLSLGETARSSNYALFEEWLSSVLATTL